MISDLILINVGNLSARACLSQAYINPYQDKGDKALESFASLGLGKLRFSIFMKCKSEGEMV